ncbi:ATP-binding protein [Algoriphagus machipongonensis]|uniref:histidine kinase n=1 Tax=Algoriphagus machipongonensis TaxID=388413 RepID=A3I0I6_9BACT|nr:ATP-binding protein [Algoriphagus machipongonensis]EAZ79982.1 sensor histidine kinase/response regulator fusion protein [Algoriphagus machipongonensis]
MQERGINSTFKKIIYESSEMVFLADDTYPYSIFYGNESFENQIGESLKEKTLAGLGLDINAYIFKEELILTHEGKDFNFKLELPHESGTNYFLFYKGKEVKTHGLPSKKESQQFFRSSLDIIAIGQHDYLTYLNGAAQPVLGYEVGELLNNSLCSHIHPDDLGKVRDLWRNHSLKDSSVFFEVRVKTKKRGFKVLECSVQFSPDRFFIIARDITERTEKKNRELQVEQLMIEAPDQNKSGTWQYDSEEEKLILNPVAAQFFGGIKTIDFANESLSSGLEEFKKLWKKAFQLALSKAGESEEFEIQLAGAQEKFLKVKILPFEEQQKIHAGIIWDDYSNQKKNKKIEALETLFNVSIEPSMVVFPDGEIFLSNEQTNLLFGLDSTQELKHLKELSSLFEHSELWKDWIKNSDEEIFKTHSNILNGQGKQFFLETSVKSTNIDGQRYIQLSFRNISEKLELEKTLEKNNDFLMNLTEQVPGGLYQMVLDSEGRMNFSFLSKGITSVLGISPEEMDEVSDISVAISKVHPMDLPKVIMSSVASSKKQEPWQCQFRVKSGVNSEEYRWVLGAARPQLLANGDMVWYGYLTDISEQKEFENKLNEARMTAEKASQIKSEFLSMISHELRTPLNAISGSVYSLLQEETNSSQESALNTINFAVDNLIIMINDLLDFQKIEAGKLTIEKEPFQFQNLINQIIKGLSFHAGDSKNNLNLHISEGLEIWLKGDKTRLSQILNNLITNALKFTNEGDVDVTVKLKESSNEKAKVYFEVKDSGIGIAKENQDKIFNDFDQVRPTFSTKYGGTGLGLSITRKLLQLMGGTIQLESEVGKGSKFYFELEFDVAEHETNALVPAENVSLAPKVLHLLMAEDNDVNALVLGKIIKKWGYTYDRVLNGEEAVAAAKSNSYDCILMDIQMPVMDGFDATVAIKSFSDKPVIALTAAAKLEIMEKIDQCGFDGFVAKPIDAAELLKSIKDVISKENYKP